MARYKKINYQQSLLLPVVFNDQVLEGTFEYALCYLFDNGHIKTSIFDHKYKNDKTGRLAFEPSVLLKIILLAYSKGVYSSRRIEALCENNILFKAISGNSNPDHSTIANFISTMSREIQEVFVDVLVVCNELNMIGGEIFALDGHKVSSNASKEWSGKISDLEKKKNKLTVLMEGLLKRHKETDVIDEKEDYKKRIIKYKNRIEKLTSFLQGNKGKAGKRISEIQSNVTDNESARMKSSHGVIQGYTGEAMVDAKNQVIVCAEAFGESHEQGCVGDMVIGTENNLYTVTKQKEYLKNKILLADNGNFSESNLKFLNNRGINAYIPDNNFRKRDERFITAKRHKRSKKNEKIYYHLDKFKYDKKSDSFFCPTGNVLRRVGKETVIRNRYLGKKYEASSAACKDCKIRNKCLRNKKARHRTILIVKSNPGEISYSEQMKRKIDSKEGREIYSRRMGIVEPVFANIRFHKKLDYFTMRSKEKVDIQWKLFSLIHNIDKIRKYV